MTTHTGTAGLQDSSTAEGAVYRHIIESALDYAILATDQTGAITTWSRGAAILFGYPAGEIIGEDIGRLFTFDDRLQGRPQREMRTALAGGSIDDTCWHLRKDGSHVWVSGQMMVLRDDEERAAGFVKIMRDQTKTLQEDEARENEERLKLILDSATDYAIFTFKRDGSIMTWNTGARRIFGYTEADIIGKDARKLFMRQESEAGALEWEMETASRQGRAENERFHVRSDGSTFWGSGLTMPLKARRDLPGFLKVLRDDTRRHFEREHQEVLNKEMNHRVKNSLMLVSGMLSMQVRASSDDEVKRVLSDAETRVATIAKVHDHLWRQPETESVDLAKFLQELCDRLALASEQHTLLVNCEPCVLDTDRAIQLALLVNELVTNAFKHAYPNGGGKVTVSLVNCGEHLEMAVLDEGIGLPEDLDVQGTSGKSLGMKLIFRLASQLRGQLRLANCRPGASCTVAFPRK
jgi:PAS domain S-box-containing protein